MNTVIEITDHHIKMVQGRIQAGRVQVLHCVERPIKSGADTEITRILVEITRGKSVEPDKLIFAIPRKNMIVKRMKLPSSQDQEIHKMIGLQLVGQVPFAIDEIIYDHLLVNKDKEGHSHIQVVVVNKNITTRYLRLLKEAGIKSARMTASSIGLMQWGSHFLKTAKEPAGAPALFVNVDYGTTEIIVIEKEKLLLTRNIQFGAKDVPDLGGGEILRQVQLSLMAYKKDNMGPNIHKIFIVMDSQDAGSVRDALAHGLDIPVVNIKSFDYIACKKNLLKNNRFVSAMAAVIGLHFPDLKKTVNLTPAEVHVGKQQSIMRRHWVLFFILLTAVFTLTTGYFWLDVQFKEKQLSSLQKELNEFGPRLERIQEMQNFIEVFSADRSKRIYIPLLIDRIYRLTPEDISFRTIILDEKKQLTIQGYAESSQGINRFQQNLVRSPEIHAVNLQFATKRRIFNMEVTDFKMIAELLGEDRNE